ncbi:hypothetical protein FJU08_19510 [Martelella alba]|uniref:Transposase n=1 Tax=Martelella alba TaxID=2590451 RepID=A0A506TZY0_9HYPH|nr:hypothetical protein FJU08_19510 [Martelella alba]
MDFPAWTHICNWRRPHGSLKSKTPISRLALNRDNLLRLHTAKLHDRRHQWFGRSSRISYTLDRPSI